MDFNENGWVELREVAHAADVGSRKKEVDGKEYIEYFFFKDGFPAYIDCSS
jgi:hypothetical protein